VGQQGQLAAVSGKKDAEKGACETFVCTEWYDNDALSAKSKQSSLWGQSAQNEATGELLSAASGVGSYGSGGQSQGFFDSFGWSPLVGQAAFGYGQGGYAFMDGYGGKEAQQAVGKTGAASSVTAYKNHEANAASKKCVSYRCGFMNVDSAQNNLGPNYYANYGGHNGAGAYTNAGQAGYGGAGQLDYGGINSAGFGGAFY